MTREAFCSEVNSDVVNFRAASESLVSVAKAERSSGSALAAPLDSGASDWPVGGAAGTVAVVGVRPLVRLALDDAIGSRGEVGNGRGEVGHHDVAIGAVPLAAIARSHNARDRRDEELRHFRVDLNHLAKKRTQETSVGSGVLDSAKGPIAYRNLAVPSMTGHGCLWNLSLPGVRLGELDRGVLAGPRRRSVQAKRAPLEAPDDADEDVIERLQLRDARWRVDPEDGAGR